MKNCRTGSCLKIHSSQLYAPLCGIFGSYKVWRTSVRKQFSNTLKCGSLASPGTWPFTFYALSISVRSHSSKALLLLRLICKVVLFMLIRIKLNLPMDDEGQQSTEDDNGSQYIHLINRAGDNGL